MDAERRAVREEGEYKMEVKEISKKGNKLSFLIKKADLAFVNTLRRMIIDEVPTMAIEDVEFRKNDSVMYDEMVSLRLGLIPLVTDLKAYNLPSKCTCKGEGCAKCQVELSLKTKASGYVDAAKLKSKDPKIVPVYEEMPITKLINEQELEFIAIARLGKGRNHAKWSPGLAWFNESAKLEVKSSDAKKLEKAFEKIPKGQVKLKAGKVQIDEPLSLDAAHMCEEADSSLFKATPIEGEYIFELESWGQLKPKTIIETAATEFVEKLDEFEGLLK